MNALERLNIKISNDKKYVNEALGISDEKMQEIFEAVDDAYRRNEKISEMLQELLTKYDGAEAVFAVLSLGVKLGVRKTLERLSAMVSYTI